MQKIMIGLTTLITILFSSACGLNGLPQSHTESAPTPVAKYPNSLFTLSSPEITQGQALPREFTCDGASATLPLEWSNGPEDTQSFAVIMHHVPGPGDSHWYWVLYNIPATVDSLPKNVTGVGTLGNNSVNGQTEYAPPCSKGPGLKTYTYTVYALSAQPQFTVEPSEIDRNTLLTALSDITLASAELNVTYSR